MGLFSTFEAVEILKRDAQIVSLTEENERLRALVEAAYREGFRDEWTFFDKDFIVEVENGWNISKGDLPCGLCLMCI